MIRILKFEFDKELEHFTLAYTKFDVYGNLLTVLQPAQDKNEAYLKFARECYNYLLQNMDSLIEVSNNLELELPQWVYNYKVLAMEVIHDLTTDFYNRFGRSEWNPIERKDYTDFFNGRIKSVRFCAGEIVKITKYLNSQL